MEREYKEITLPVSNKVVKLKTWLTAREQRELRSVFLDNVSFAPSDEKSGENLKPEFKMNGSLLDKAQDKAFEIIIESVDGKSDKVLDTVLDLRVEDYDFLVAEINKISNPSTEETEEGKKK